LNKGDFTMKTQGFSIIGLMIILAVLAAIVDVGYQVIPIYNVKSSVQSVFDSMVTNQSDLTEVEVKNKLPEVLEVAYINVHSDLPPEFLDNLVIVSQDDKLDLSTFYHEEVWLLGMPAPYEDLNLAEEDMDLNVWEQIQVKARLDFDFDIAAHTP